MIWNKKFDYKDFQRSLIQGSRHYDVEGNKLPSVTTILSQTKSEADKKGIADGIARVGQDQATRTKDQAAARGTIMHKMIEKFLHQEGHEDLTDLGLEARPMADKICQIGLTPLEEVWGTEVMLHYPDLYAGSTDLCGIYNSRESIIDFKQSNKPKRREWISDYFSQVAAYAMAHDYQFGTQINQCVIMICTKPPEVVYQDFVLEGNELKQAKYTFLRKVDTYYKSQKNFSENKKS